MQRTAYMPLDLASVQVTYELDGTDATVVDLMVNGMVIDPSVIAENIVQGWEEELTRAAREDAVCELEERMPLWRACELLRRQAA